MPKRSSKRPPPSQGNELFLGEEELSDVSLGTFYVFDKENTGAGFFFGACVGCVGYACGGRAGWAPSCWVWSPGWGWVDSCTPPAIVAPPPAMVTPPPVTK
jgi:hypothetical protein